MCGSVLYRLALHRLLRPHQKNKHSIVGREDKEEDTKRDALQETTVETSRQSVTSKSASCQQEVTTPPTV